MTGTDSTTTPDGGDPHAVEQLRELLAGVIAAVTPLVAQAAPGPDAPEAACTWCPLCALVALSRGEQHPLLTAIGTQGVALLTALRDLLADSVAAHEPAQHGAPGHGPHQGSDGRNTARQNGSGQNGSGQNGSGRNGSGPRPGGTAPEPAAAPRFEAIPVMLGGQPSATDPEADAGGDGPVPDGDVPDGDGPGGPGRPAPGRAGT